MSPLLEVGAEFQNELTARENIFLYGAIFGLTRKEIKEKLKGHEIIKEVNERERRVVVEIG